jgi:hypothetical protein
VLEQDKGYGLYGEMQKRDNRKKYMGDIVKLQDHEQTSNKRDVLFLLMHPNNKYS